MSRQLAKLISVYRNLSDRYGHDDPLVVQLKEEVERGQAQADARPVGERRKVDLAPHLWNQRLHRGHSLYGERPGP